MDGKAQKQWWPMEAKLRSDGLDPHVFSVFKAAMLTRWAPMAPGLNAHGRLDALKQNKSVDTYIDAFNSIVSNAIDNPIVGAEACCFFQKGLKDSISSLLLKNSSTGGLGEFLTSLNLLHMLRHSMHTYMSTYVSTLLLLQRKESSGT